MMSTAPRSVWSRQPVSNNGFCDAPDWRASTAYTSGDEVAYNGSMYRALVDNLGAVPNPSDTPAKWAYSSYACDVGAAVDLQFSACGRAAAGGRSPAHWVSDCQAARSQRTTASAQAQCLRCSRRAAWRYPLATSSAGPVQAAHRLTFLVIARGVPGSAVGNTFVYTAGPALTVVPTPDAFATAVRFDAGSQMAMLPTAVTGE
jgi:hypothetical protein